jgi:hypothetical protein
MLDRSTPRNWDSKDDNHTTAASWEPETSSHLTLLTMTLSTWPVLAGFRKCCILLLLRPPSHGKQLCREPQQCRPLARKPVDSTTRGIFLKQRSTSWTTRTTYASKSGPTRHSRSQAASLPHLAAGQAKLKLINVFLELDAAAAVCMMMMRAVIRVWIC